MKEVSLSTKSPAAGDCPNQPPWNRKPETLQVNRFGFCLKPYKTLALNQILINKTTPKQPGSFSPHHPKFPQPQHPFPALPLPLALPVQVVRRRPWLLTKQNIPYGKLAVRGQLPHKVYSVPLRRLVCNFAGAVAYGTIG